MGPQGVNGDDDRERVPLGSRQPPHSTDAERSVCLNVVLSPEVIPDVMHSLPTPEDFYHADCREIYRSVLDLYGRGEVIDVLSVAEDLERRDLKWIAHHNGPLAEICQGPNFSWHAVEHALIVRQKSILRGVMETAEGILREGYANRRTADEVLSDSIGRLQGIATEHMGSGTVTVADMLPKVMDRMEQRQKGIMFGLPTGFADLDLITDGFQPQELIVVGARSSMGKTSMALQICDHVSVTWKQRSLFVSLEMGEQALAERVLISRARVDGHKVRTGQPLSHEEMARIGKAYEEITQGGGPIHILVRPTRNVSQIVAEIRAIKVRKSIDLLVIDYVQLIDSDNPKDTEVQALTKTSKAVKGLARDLNIPVILLSQLNRGLESREDKTPRMSDLRGSGTLEQDADIILLVHRPEYFDPNDRPGIAQLVVAKNRSGRTGDIDMVFRKELMRFENIAKDFQRPTDPAF